MSSSINSNPNLVNSNPVHGRLSYPLSLLRVFALGASLLVLTGKLAHNPATMIWYFLAIFRGTTEPPILDAKHPLRHAFTRYGYHAARHPVITLLISVAAAAILAYPFPFLYTNNFTNGASNLPHHVWTSAQPYEGKAGAQADVAMRSIWVHGSYMKALEPKVLLSALEIQDHLLGPTLNFDPRRPKSKVELGHPSADLTPDMRDTLHATNGVTNSSWFFHSPLQYWSGSSEAITNDQDIIATVNKGASISTSVNVTLRHSIVFSGKRFEDHKLVAADALVITLIHALASPVGRQWERKAEELAHNSAGRWRLYPSDGRSISSTLYEFRFQPLSLQDDLFLGIAYALACLYFILSLSKLRALKSRLGLILAVVTQLGVSIISSFTICAVFKIDLSKIPREAYPVVILTVGLENIFRYINAVIITPSETATAIRMGEALGVTGHIALAGVAQNLAILWALSNVVSPQIKAFCTFAAIALTFDFFYMLTFFTGVLSVELRRTELGDSLQRISARGQDLSFSSTEPKRTWTAAFIQGEAPFSTRIAGTIVMVGFVLIAQWHFFDNESFGRTALRLLRLLKSEPQPPRSSMATTLSIDINQARTPTAWLRLQDHETAHEVIKIVKPNANRYLARVYEPLVFVVDGSDRTPNTLGVRPFLPAAYDFVRHQSTPFFITVTLCVAAVSLLMHYLLWDETPEIEEEERPEDDHLISIKSLSRGHSLDVVLMAASQEGVIASVGLDRWIRIWDVRKGIYSYIVHDPESPNNPFPVLAMAIDSDSNWLALMSAQNRVFLWNLPERRWGPVIDVDVKGRTPVAFFFGYDKSDLIDPLVVVRSNGLMTELHIESERSESKDLLICQSSLVAVQKHFEKPTATGDSLPRIITASKRGCVHVATQLEDGWVSKGVDFPTPSSVQDPISILSLPSISSFLVVHDQSVDLVDVNTYKIVHVFPTSPMIRGSLRCFHSTRRRPQCGSVGLASLGLAYNDLEGNLVVQSYLPFREGDTLCFRDPWTPGSKTCCLWNEAIEHRYIVENPGKWEALQVGYVVGIRKLLPKTPAADQNDSPSTSGLRRRILPSRPQRSPPKEEEDQWEVWCISARGERVSLPLCNKNDAQDHLLVNSLGPMIKVGRRSVAVGLGNIIKVITIGNERFDGKEDSDDDTAFVGMKASTLRRKKAPARKRTS